MNEQETRNLIRQQIASSNAASRYQLTPTSQHTHNGLDSPTVSFTDLTNRQTFITSHVPSSGAATASNYGHFYVHPHNAPPASVLTMEEVHGQAGTDSGVVTVGVAILSSGDASLSGGTILHNFNLKATANIASFSTLIQGQNPAILKPGTRLALQTSGTLTSVADVLVTVVLQY